MAPKLGNGMRAMVKFVFHRFGKGSIVAKGHLFPGQAVYQSKVLVTLQ